MRIRPSINGVAGNATPTVAIFNFSNFRTVILKRENWERAAPFRPYDHLPDFRKQVHQYRNNGRVFVSVRNQTHLSDSLSEISRVSCQRFDPFLPLIRPVEAHQDFQNGDDLRRDRGRHRRRRLLGVAVFTNMIDQFLEN